MTLSLAAGSHAQLSAIDLQDLSVPASPEARVQVEAYVGSTPVTLDLSQMSLIGGALQARHLESQRPTITYRGRIAEDPGSRVVASLRDGELRAMIWQSADPEPWWLAPADEVEAGQPEGLYSVLRTQDLPGNPLSFDCGVDTDSIRPREGGGSWSSSTQLLEAEIVLEGDFEYYSAFNDVQAAEDEILETMNFVSAIYESTVGIRFKIVHLNVWDDAADPYSATSSSSAILFEFRQYVLNNFPATDYDMAQLLTRRNAADGVAGMAYQDRLCRPSTTIPPNPSSFARRQPTLSRRVILSAHEFGHTADASHCSNSDCGIMWQGLDGGPLGARFGTASTLSIAGNPNLGNCLDVVTPNSVPPTISSVAPLVLEALVPGSAGESMTINGTQLDDTHQIDFGGDIQTLQEIRVVDDQLVFVTPPTPASFGTVDVSALNAAGWSNTVQVTYVQTSPPRHDAPSTQGLVINVEAGGVPGVAAQILLATDPTTTSIGGFDVLANPLQTQTSTLDAVGLTSAQFFSSAVGTTHWVQFLTRDENGAFFATAPTSVLLQ